MLTACLFLERAGCRQSSASATTCSTTASGPIRCLRRWPSHSQLTQSEHPVSSAHVPFPHASWLYPNQRTGERGDDGREEIWIRVHHLLRLLLRLPDAATTVTARVTGRTNDVCRGRLTSFR